MWRPRRSRNKPVWAWLVGRQMPGTGLKSPWTSGRRGKTFTACLGTSGWFNKRFLNQTLACRVSIEGSLSRLLEVPQVTRFFTNVCESSKNCFKNFKIFCQIGLCNAFVPFTLRRRTKIYFFWTTLASFCENNTSVSVWLFTTNNANSHHLVLFARWWNTCAMLKIGKRSTKH